MALQLYSGEKCSDMYRKNKKRNWNFRINVIDAVYSIRKSGKRPGINSIFKALVKNNSTNIDIPGVQKEVASLVEKGHLENKKTCQRLDSFFILNIIQTVFNDDNNTLRKEFNLDFNPDVIPEQVTFSVETPEVYQQINATPYGATDFSSQLLAVKALFMS